MRRRRHEGAARWRCPYSEPSIAAKTEFEIAPVAWLTGANDQDILDCTKLKTFQFLISRSRINLVHGNRSEEHTSELQSLMRISYAVFCLKKKTQQKNNQDTKHRTCE